jgi:hypothetical protein
VRGGLASESAVQTLVDSIVGRLCEDGPQQIELVPEHSLAK